MFKQKMFQQNYRVGVPLISKCICTLELLLLGLLTSYSTIVRVQGIEAIQK
jgi:hypothetical protein